MSAPPAVGSTELPFLKLLEGLRPLEITGHEPALVARIASFAGSHRLLELIVSVPKWYGCWEVREALFGNPATPEPLREQLGSGIAVIDLMREMAAPGMPEAERQGIREDIRSLLRGLPPVDHEIVKAHARSLAGAAGTLAPPPATAIGIAGMIATAEQRAIEEATRAAASTDSPTALSTALGHSDERPRGAALENPHLDEPTLLAAIAATTEPLLLTAIATTPRWIFREPVRRALLANPRLAAPVRRLLETTAGILLSFLAYFNQPATPEERAQIAKGILADVQALPAPEREYVKFKVGAAWAPFVHEVMGFIEEDFRQIRPVPVSTIWPAAAGPPPSLPDPLPTPLAAPLPPEIPHTALAPDSFDATRHDASPLHKVPISAETRRELAHLPREDRATIAASTRERDELAFLIHDADDRVFAALLGNPALSPLDLVAAVRNASRERIRKVVELRPVYALQAVKLALLHNPHAPEAIQIECLDHIGSARELLQAVRDPRIRSLEVKAKARARLRERYQAMSPDERVAAIKQTGGDLLNEVWNDAFADERTILRLVQDRGLDEGVVLRIARSRVAPRAVLAAIAMEPAFTRHYQVRLELATNPKTPREVAARLAAKLAPADRERIQKSSSVADFVRAAATGD